MKKREMFFKDKKKRRERQMKGKKKLLDGSDSEGNEDSEDGRERTQSGAYDSLTLLGSTSCAPLTQTKGTPETEQIERELNKIELNNTNTSPQYQENLKNANAIEQKGNTKEDRSGLLTNEDYLELDFTSEAENDSLEDISRMQENSPTSCFNVGVDEASAGKSDQSTNQGETTAETMLEAAPQDISSEVKLEASSKEISIKKEPVTGLQVITADFYRKFIEDSTGYGKPPLNPKDERD